MTEKANWSAKLLTWFCVGVMVLALCSIGLRIFTSTILVEKFGMNNAFAELVFFDAKGIISTGADENTSEERVIIDWAALYPFAEEDVAADATEETGARLADRLKAPIEAIEKNFETYSTEYLMGYNFLTERERAYKDSIQWGFLSYGEYNGVLDLGNNFFTGYSEKKDVTEAANSTVELASFCEEQDTDFLYVQLPFKISKYDDPELSGTVDYSNQNADDFLALLDENGVDYYDLRETIHEEGLNYRDLFYETDHHWKAETGLWAAGKFLDQLALRGYDVDSENLAPELFDYVVYPNWFLGSQGKKVTLARAEPENITLIYPKAETKFHYVVFTRGINEIGDFSITYDMDCIEPKDYLQQSPYLAYNHGFSSTMQRIENMITGNKNQILLIRDSFCDCVIPFLAMEIGRVDSLDIRNYTGSVQNYIEQTHPDAVIVIYTASSIKDIDWSTHTSTFDFR